MSTCAAQTRTGVLCQRLVTAGTEHCWQHSRGLSGKWRSLTRNQSIAFVIAIASVVLSIIAWSFPQAWNTPKPNFVEVRPVLWLERPNEISFTVSNNGSTAINNIAISIHDLDAAAAWVIANTHGGRMLGTSEQFDAATIRLINIQALSPHTAATRAAFYNLSGLTVRRFMLDTFAGDETSRLFVKLAKVNGQWLIATSLSRRTGDEQQQTIENIPPRFPRDIEGKVDFN